MDKIQELERIKGYLKLPISYDPNGTYIWDSRGRMVCDVRGWGAIQKLENAEQKQDDIGKLIAELLNNYLQQLQAEQQLSGNHSKLDIVSEQPILTYEQGLERGRQIGHKEGWRDAKAEQPKQIDIDKIISDGRDRVADIDKYKQYRGVSDNEEMNNHLTQNTTVPKDGEVVEIKKDKELGYGKCDICGCGNDFSNIYCNGCLKEIIRID